MSTIREYIRFILEEQALCSLPKALFMAGGPGSGKSTVINSIGLKGKLRVINADDTYEESLRSAGIPLDRGELVKKYKMIKSEYEQAKDDGDTTLAKELEPGYLSLRAVMSQNMKLFAAARAAAKNEQQKYICAKQNFLVDGTGGDRRAILKQVKELRDLGYDVGMIFVDVPLQTSVDRNRFRGKSGGRGLHDDTVVKSWSAVDKNKQLYEDLFGNNFFYVDASELQFQESIEKVTPAVLAFLGSK